LLFHSLEFAIFFVIVFSLYSVLKHQSQNRLLLVASYVFYGAWDWRYLSLLLISTTVDFFCSHAIRRTNEQPRKNLFLTLSIFSNLTLLGIFKYYDFFAFSFQEFMGKFGLSVEPYFLRVALPIGISFYTFQTMSYSIDVYRKKLEPAENYFDFALFVAFFPQLIAGPIERGTRLLPQILKPRVVNWERVYHGLYFFGWGLFLKVFIADNLAVIVDRVYGLPAPYEGASVILATFAFSFQIYCDFAGYSFMAIGLAKAMGIDLMENFRRPYFSLNISEFWRRWHISLSSWFRDYFFTPFYLWCQKSRWLAGLSVKGKHAIAFFGTLFATEYLLGFWHGAGWNFGLFGLYHAFAIWLYYYVRNYWDKMPVPVQILLTYLVTCGGWLVFRAQTLGQAVDMFASVFTNIDFANLAMLSGEALQFAGFVGILVAVQVFQDRARDTLIVLRWPPVIRYPFFLMMAMLILVFGDFSDRPFIYFQF
jgi:alginate O-acetyltransferase complex protein AlgI